MSSNFTNTTTYTLDSFDYGFIGIQAILLTIAFSLFIAMVLLRNYNPLKSRGPSHLIGVALFACLLIRVLLQVLSIFDIKSDTSVTRNWSCYWFILSQAPVMIIFICFALLNMVKYVVTEELNRAKEDVLERHRHNQTLAGGNQIDDAIMLRRTFWLVKVGKILISWWITVPLLVIAAISWIVIEVLIVAVGSAVTGEQCMMSASKGILILNIMQGVSIGLFLLLGLASLIFFIFDIILFTKRNGLQIIKYFKDDVFFFRIEYMVILSIIVMATAVVSYGFFARTQNRNDLLIIIVIAIMQVIVVFAVSGFLVLVTLIQMLRGCRKNIDPTSIRAVLLEKRGRDLFFAFSKREWSHENVIAYEEIQTLRRMRSSQQLIKARELFQTFFKPGAMVEVNLSHPVRNVLQKYEVPELVTDDNFLGPFDDVEQEILENLKDTFHRFARSTEYLHWAKQYEMKDQSPREHVPDIDLPL